MSSGRKIVAPVTAEDIRKWEEGWAEMMVTIWRENMVDSMRAQIRMLTKGDVSKKDYILNHVDTWTALEELDAQAQELEEIKQRNGSK